MRNEGIGSWTARRARTSPERMAVIHEGTRHTYAELHERVLRLAAVLRELGVRRGDRVAYLGANHPALLESLFACGALGAIFVPLNTRLAVPELTYMLHDSGTQLVLHGVEHEPQARELLSTGQISTAIGVTDPGPDGYEQRLVDAVPQPLDTRVGLEEPCMIMYTSGTTGRPKGAVLTHGNITWNCVNVLLDVDLTADEVTLVSAPMFHTAALNMTCLPTLLKGGRLVIAPRFTPDLALDLIEKERITWMFGVPAMFNALATSPRWTDADLSSLRMLEAGGAPVPESTIRTYQERGLTFLQGYGMTEASPGVLFLGEADSVRKAGTAGRPSFFTDARVARPDGSTAAPEEPGEMVVRGPNIMYGYWGRDDATEITRTDDGWFRTGDVAVADAEGFVRIIDRLTDMFISGGENVYPAEVENVLHAHPAVDDCAVVGVPDATWGEVGHAHVIVHDGSSVTDEELVEHCRTRLARYKTPVFFSFVSELPRNASGKLLRHRLRHSPRPPTTNAS